jgi:hypothetical protein
MLKEEVSLIFFTLGTGKGVCGDESFLGGLLLKLQVA